MAGIYLGASSPTSTTRPTPRMVPNTRTRRNHGAFLLGDHLACVYSTRSASRRFGVSFELGAGTLSVAGTMTSAQARCMARALCAAADAVDLVNGGPSHG